MVKAYRLYNQFSVETNIVSWKTKVSVPKRTHNKLYCTYIRPLLEYASEVWDGCNLSDTNRLEQV